MLVNELEYSELSKLIRPILCLEPLDNIVANFVKILRFDIKTKNDIVCQDQMLIRYKGFRVDIRDFRWIEEKGLSFIMQFKAKKKWWYDIFFKDQNLEIVKDLKSICTTEISGLDFSKFTHAYQFESSEPSSRLVFYHDSKAFNPNWKEAYDISPLIIAPDEHHDKCFVEFLFNAGGYMRLENKTILRTDWLESVFDISEGIKHGAQRILGLK